MRMKSTLLNEYRTFTTLGISFIFAAYFVINHLSRNLLLKPNSIQENPPENFSIFHDADTKPCRISADIDKVRSELLAMITGHSNAVSTSKNDFAYITIIPVTNSVDPIVNETASAWCQSIRTIHSLRSNYDIVALFPSRTLNFHLEKFKCFDKLMFVDEVVKAYIGNRHASIDISVISKAWLFSLVQYKRIIFMKYNLAPVRSNIYNYFFKDYYLTDTGHHVDGRKKESMVAPKKLYTQSSLLSPINSDFMSLEPDVNTAVELLSIYTVSQWNVNTGWNCYGSFDFDPLSRMESFEDPNEPSKQYQFNRKKDVRPWHQSLWSFDSSWSDTGLIFYYQYLMSHPEMSGIIYELDFDHSLIEYVSF